MSEKIVIDGWELINEYRAFTKEEKFVTEHLTSRPMSYLWFIKKNERPEIYESSISKTKSLEEKIKPLLPEISSWERQNDVHPELAFMPITSKDSMMCAIYCKSKNIATKIIKKLKGR